MDSHKRSLCKAFSWRILGSLTTAVIAFVLTHNVNIATQAGFIDFFAKILFFYVHERAWTKIPFLR